MAYASQPTNDDIAIPDPTDPRAKTRTIPKLVIGDRWRRWLSGLTTAVNSKPSREASVTLTAQGASLATTSLPIGSVTPGVWGIYTTLRVTRAGTVSSAIRLTIGWTEGGVTQTQQGTNLTGNLTTTREGLLFLVRPDNATVITYATTYADGGGAVSMQYSLDLVAVQLAADA